MTSGSPDSQSSAVNREARKVVREQRRVRQRSQNVVRQKKMHQARLLLKSSVPLPDGSTASHPRQAHVGCSGWFYWHWKGTFYPADLKQSEWFPHYARRFNTVELNAPFYSWPTVGNVQSWVRQAGRRKFIYTVKACELITHVKRFAGTKNMIRDFGHIADLLGNRMGCFLFQLPPSFHFTRSRLKSILSQLENNRRNVIEFRHRSWWTTEVFQAFQNHGTIFCSASAPALPEDLVVTNGEAYLRFHGLKRWYRHDYTEEKLQFWIGRLRAADARRVWAYFNNDRDCNAIRNARTFRRLLRKEGFDLPANP